MPFCRECGKSVEADWKFCPNCNASQQSSGIFQDNVVMGDVSINDSDSIISAIKSASKCPNCGSLGTNQISCSFCNCIVYCNICEKEKTTEKLNLFAKPNMADDTDEFYFEKYMHYWVNYQDTWVPEHVKSHFFDRSCLNCLEDKLKIKCNRCNKYTFKEDVEAVISEIKSRLEYYKSSKSKYEDIQIQVIKDIEIEIKEIEKGSNLCLSCYASDFR